jgi:hypothetical protein
MISTVLGKVALSFGALTMSAGGAAAATGNLPAPAESAVHSVLGAVGVQSDDGADTEEAAPTSTTVVPTTTAPAAAPTSTTTTTVAASREADTDDTDGDDASTKGPDVSPTSPALKGLCTAWSAKPRDAEGRGPGKSDQAVPFAKLAEAAGGATEVEAYCKDALAARNSEDDGDEDEDTVDADAKAEADAKAAAGDSKAGDDRAGNGKANGKGTGKGSDKATGKPTAAKG